jgi:hypothetical protein
MVVLKKSKKSDDYSAWNIVFFDDQIESIENHARVALNMGFSVHKFDDIVNFKNYISSSENFILFLDMHVPRLRDFADIGFPEVTTGDGESVGVAIIRALLPKLGLTATPAFVLSEYDADTDVNEQLSRANSKRPIQAQYLLKDKMAQFQEAATGAVVDFQHERQKREISAARTILGEWFEGDLRKVAAALGIKYTTTDDWEELFQGSDIHNFLDVGERSRLIIYIKEALVRIFGLDSFRKEITWLKMDDSYLPNGQSPLELIADGKQASIAAVAGLLHKISG